jgi:Flp pilus assembly protein protease CpaA
MNWGSWAYKCPYSSLFVAFVIFKMKTMVGGDLKNAEVFKVFTGIFCVA